MIGIGIDVGKKSFQACLKDEQGNILGEFSLENSGFGARRLVEAVKGMPARAAIEANGNHRVRLHDLLEERGIDTVLANPVKTRLIAEARIKTDRLDARILADLLRGSLVAESCVPTRRERGWRSLVRYRASLVRMGVDVKNRIQSLLDKYEFKHEYSDLFGREGMVWLESLRLQPVDQAILECDLKLLKGLREQVEKITREIASIAADEEQVIAHDTAGHRLLWCCAHPG